MDESGVLIKLAHLGALESYINITTRELGDLIGASQQSSSLYLRSLETAGYIVRIRRNRGTSLTITRRGMDRLLGLHGQLKTIFETGREIMVRGNVSTGLGEGAYYLSQKRYTDQIRKKFGMVPFHGTLNIVLGQRNTPVLELLKIGPGIVIEGFTSGGRSFGTCLCYPCRVNDINGMIMVPKRTLHTGTLEIVSNVKLREVLDLNDGDEVQVSISYPAFDNTDSRNLGSSPGDEDQDVTGTPTGEE